MASEDGNEALASLTHFTSILI